MSRGVGGARDRMTLYRAALVYEYEVAGKRFRGSRIAQSPGLDRGVPEFAAKVVERYPGGSAVAVRYNPKRPDESVLEPRVPGSWIFGAAIGVALLVLAVYTYYRGEGKAKRRLAGLGLLRRSPHEVSRRRYKKTDFRRERRKRFAVISFGRSFLEAAGDRSGGRVFRAWCRSIFSRARFSSGDRFRRRRRRRPGKGSCASLYAASSSVTSWRSSSSGVLSHFFSSINEKAPPLRGLAGSKAPGKNSTHSLRHSMTEKPW